MAFYNALPLIGLHLKSSSRLNLFSPEEKQELLAKYRSHIGIGSDTTFNADAFDKLVSARAKDFTVFKDTKCPDGMTVSEKLAANTTPDEQQNVSALKNAVVNAMKPTPAFVEAQKEYNESVATFRELADKVPGAYSAAALIDTMATIKDDAIKAVKAQQAHEVRAYEDPAFKAQLAKTLKLTDPEEIDAAHASVLKDLKSSHTKHLSEFESSTRASIDALHKASATQATEILFLANLRQNNTNSVMQQRLAELEEQRRQALGLPERPTNVILGLSEDQISLTGIRIEDLAVIHSNTGKDIHQTSKGTFVMQMYTSWWGDAGYNLDPRQNFKSDMLITAEAIKAQGFDKITLDLQFENPEVANQRARQAYEAARLAGFPPDKIVINVNGKQMKPQEEVFKDHPASFAKIEEKANDISNKNAQMLKDLKESQPKSTQEELAKIKTEMGGLRTKAKEEAEARRLAQEQAQQNAQQEPTTPAPH